MEEASRSVNTYAYLSEHFEDMDFKDMLSVSGNDIYFAFNLIKNRTNSSLIKEAFLTDAVKKLADNSYIIGGSNGIHVFLTPTSSDDNMDLNIQYNISLPFLPEKLISISVNQRCFFKTFTGEDITDKTGDYTQYVYITSNSSVYHTSPYCSYLSKYYSLFPASYFEDMIADKNNYTPCHNCVNNTPPSYNVFLCPDSFVYHSRIDCFYLNANIYKVTLDSVEDVLKLCSRCRKGIN